VSCFFDLLSAGSSCLRLRFVVICSSPKSFAGLFGAAPSLALATLALTIVREGAAYASVEARSMIAGAIAFCAYACCVIYVLMRYRFRASVIASLFIVLWLGLSISLWAVSLR
jgi:hypothetical protein